MAAGLGAMLFLACFASMGKRFMLISDLKSLIVAQRQLFRDEPQLGRCG